MSNESPFSVYSARLRRFIRGSLRPGLTSNGVEESPPVVSIPSISSHSSLRACGKPETKTAYRNQSDTELFGPLLRFEALALELFALQFEHVPVYRRFCQARRVTPCTIASWADIPALPTSAFKEFEITSLSPENRSIVFHSSGTTIHRPSRHFHSQDSITLYEASLSPWFQRHLLPETAPLSTESAQDTQSLFLFLTPAPALAPHSSLVHMFETVRREFASDDSLFLGNLDRNGGWTLDKEKTWASFLMALDRNQPTVLLGTAFTFVELLDWMAEKELSVLLPPGSRVLETGGYKGRTRVLQRKDLHSLISRRLGIPRSHIVSEYGMSELSSQAYDLAADAYQSPVSKRLFRFPPWARFQIISPETGRETADGEKGLIRIFDLANVRSVMAIQTEDFGIQYDDGLELIGRAALAEPRGCSLMTAR